MRLFDIFKNKRVVLPVIHVKNYNQTKQNADISFSEGVDGVFLINHLYDYKNLLEIYAGLREQYAKE